MAIQQAPESRIISVQDLDLFSSGPIDYPPNKQADRLAKNVSDSGVMLSWILPDNFIHYHKQRTYLLTHQQCKSSKYFMSLSDIPPIK